MNVLDIVLIILFIPAIIRGISKGFIEQVIALASLFLSAWLAYLFADKVGTWLSAYIDGVSKEVLYIFAFIIIIILTVMLLNLLAKVLSKVVSAISLGLSRIQHGPHNRPHPFGFFLIQRLDLSSGHGMDGLISNLQMDF